jgi:hypothetical protein
MRGVTLNSGASAAVWPRAVAARTGFREAISFARASSASLAVWGRGLSLFGASGFASAGGASGLASGLAAGVVCAWASATQEAGGRGACDPAAPRAITAATPSHLPVDRQRSKPPFITSVSFAGL